MKSLKLKCLGLKFLFVPKFEGWKFQDEQSDQKALERVNFVSYNSIHVPEEVSHIGGFLEKWGNHIESWNQHFSKEPGIHFRHAFSTVGNAPNKKLKDALGWSYPNEDSIPSTASLENSNVWYRQIKNAVDFYLFFPTTCSGDCSISITPIESGVISLIMKKNERNWLMGSKVTKFDFKLIFFEFFYYFYRVRDKCPRDSFTVSL